MSRCLIFIILTSISTLYAAPSKDTSIQISFQEFRSQLEQHNYQINSQKVDLDLLQEKIHDLDNQISSLKKQIGDHSKIESELSKDRLTSIEKRLANLEKTNDTIITDLQQLKNHYNESAISLAQSKSKLADLDKQVTQDIKSLKKAVESLVILLQKPKDQIALSTPSKVYRVKPGDSLGKIAQDNHVEIKTLKELNHLDNDKIVVGQILNLP